MAKNTKTYKKLEKKTVSDVKNNERGDSKVSNYLKDKNIFTKVFEHYEDSFQNVVSPQLEGWDEKEAMLVNKLTDSVSSNAYSQVFDPRLSTIVFERAGRVMAQNPTGKSMAVSRDDKGKNLLMNLLLDKWILRNANAQFPFLIKTRLWDIYSLVYGSLFTLTDWVNKGDFSSPDLYLLPIRDCFPQPNKYSLEDSDWFGVSTYVSYDWLKARNRDTWKNIDEILLRMKEGAGEVKGEKDNNKRSFVERLRQPTVKSDNTYKTVEIYTEYRRDRWITICTTFSGEKYILRDIKNPHNNDRLPITVKYAFPLIDSIYGLGEFERGKTLQYAMNSLINLYLDGVKTSIYPPTILNPDGIVPSSIVYEPAAKWLETKTGSIRQFQTSPLGLNTFQSTYNFLNAALLNQAGTTDTTVSAETDVTQGKTPQALRMLSNRENARDNWDRFMMEQALEQVLDNFVNLTAKNIEKPITLRLFKNEIEQIEKVYPDVTHMFTSGERGDVLITKDKFEDTSFDFQITSGSTYKADQQEELNNVRALLSMAIDPQSSKVLNEALARKGKMIDVAELFERTVISSGTQDWDKIIVDIPTDEQVGQASLNGQQPNMEGQGEMSGQAPTPQPQEQMAPQPQTTLQDPNIRAFAEQLFSQR